MDSDECRVLKIHLRFFSLSLWPPAEAQGIYWSLLIEEAGQNGNFHGEPWRYNH